MSITDALGLSGVALILVAYLLLRLGGLPPTRPSFSLANALGSFLALAVDFNLAAALLEAVWLVVSLFGLYRCVTLARTNH